MTGMTRAGIPRRPRFMNMSIRSLLVRLTSTKTSLLLRSIQTLRALRSTIVTIPGPTVERKHARTEMPLIQANIMRVAFGGIRSPSSDAFAISAQACPIGYPPCLRRGNIIAPMQESVAQAAPQIDPNTAQETTATIPSPPRICPTKTSTISISFSAMRPRSIMPPASMNIAIAISETEFICVKP